MHSYSAYFFACMWLHVRTALILIKYVPVIGFSSVVVSACVQISMCNYSDSQGNCPSSPTTKRILILSGLTVPPNEGGRRGMAMSFPWRTTRVWHFVVSCDGKAGKRKQKSLQTWPEGGGRLLLNTEGCGRWWGCAEEDKECSASAACNQCLSPACLFLSFPHSIVDGRNIKSTRPTVHLFSRYSVLVLLVRTSFLILYVLLITKCTLNGYLCKGC